MVAPVNKAKSARNKGLQNSPFQRDVLRLRGGEDASPQMAPDLHFVLRRLLEQQQIKSDTIESYLADNPAIKRYNSGFKKFYAALQTRGVTPETASNSEAVETLIQMHAESPAQARNAYPSVLLLPNMGKSDFT